MADEQLILMLASKVSALKSKKSAYRVYAQAKLDEFVDFHSLWDIAVDLTLIDAEIKSCNEMIEMVQKRESE